MHHLQMRSELKTYLTGSDYNDYESPQFFKRGTNAIKRANRKHSRKRKGSKNQERARINLARKHRKIANQRQDFHWKLAHDLTRPLSKKVIVIQHI